jgi:uncharacterized Zn finger protein
VAAASETVEKVRNRQNPENILEIFVGFGLSVLFRIFKLFSEKSLDLHGF